MRNNTQNITAHHSSDANTSGSEKCGFMSEIKDYAAGLCGLKKTKEQIDFCANVCCRIKDLESYCHYVRHNHMK